MEEAYQRYRNQGTALMTTIIGLSSGAIYGLRDSKTLDAKILLMLMVPPIILCISQELLAYLGAMAEARFLHLFATLKASTEKPEKEVNELLDTVGEASRLSNRAYGFADKAAMVSVGVFIVCLATLTVFFITGAAGVNP
jgi:hypothetical protein